MHIFLLELRGAYDLFHIIIIKITGITIILVQSLSIVIIDAIKIRTSNLKIVHLSPAVQIYSTLLSKIIVKLHFN